MGVGAEVRSQYFRGCQLNEEGLLGSGSPIEVQEYLNGEINDVWPYKAVCPHCGRVLRVRLAGGGYEGYANYAYLPNHKVKI